MNPNNRLQSLRGKGFRGSGSGFGHRALGTGQENVWSDNLDTSFILNATASIPGPAVVFSSLFPAPLFPSSLFRISCANEIDTFDSSRSEGK